MWQKHVQFWLDRTHDTPSNSNNKNDIGADTSAMVSTSVADPAAHSRTPPAVPARQNGPPRLIVRYEDLKRAPAFYVRHIAEWLGFTVADERLQCALAHANNMVRS
jgi:hypothetical protein